MAAWDIVWRGIRHESAEALAQAGSTAPSEPADSAEQPLLRNVAITIGAVGRTAAEVARLRSVALKLPRSSCSIACRRRLSAAGRVQTHVRWWLVPQFSTHRSGLVGFHAVAAEGSG